MPAGRATPAAGMRRFIRAAFAGTVGVVAGTTLCLRLHSSFAIASFVFLVIVLVQSLSGEFLACFLVSVEAVLCLDYFFVDPLYSFNIMSGEDVVALIGFLLTALLVTRLMSRISAEAEYAGRERRRLGRFYRLAQQLLAMEPDSGL